MRLVAIAAMGTTVALGATAVLGQTATGAAPSIVLVMQPAVTVRAKLVCEIDDPSTGARWLLLRDDARPAGPGRLVLVVGSKADSVTELAAATQKASATEDTVIRTGDALIVEQHSPIIDARLQAMALGSAAPGNVFPARLTIGGKVVRALAIAAGRAVFVPESEAGR
jgi:hypothetical protein